MVEKSIGVIFDMDGVLVDSAHAHFESWRRLGEEIGVAITPHQFLSTFGRQNRDIVPLFFGEPRRDQSDVLSDQKERIYRRLIRERLPIVPGAVELVRMLFRARMRLAIGSSAPPANLDLVLELAGIRDYFRAIVSAADVARGKPHPEVFQLSADRLGLPADRCIVIEDAAVGVEAAKAAGAKCIAVMMHHSRDELAMADLVVERLADLSVEAIAGLIRES